MIMMKCHRFSEHKTLTIELLQFLLFNVHWDFRFWLLLRVTFFYNAYLFGNSRLVHAFLWSSSYVFFMLCFFLLVLSRIWMLLFTFLLFETILFYAKDSTNSCNVAIYFFSFRFFSSRYSSIHQLRAVYFMSICLHCRTLSSIDQIIMMQNLLYALWQCQDMDGHHCIYRRQRFLCAGFFFFFFSK